MPCDPGPSTLAAATDAQLAARCCSGDEAAIAELVKRFHARVFGLCRRMLDHRQDAEDAAQDSLIRMVRGLGGWDNRRALAPWVLAIAANRCRTYLDARRRRPSTRQIVDSLPDRRLDTAHATNWNEDVQQALSELRPEYREAFVLFHEQQLSCQEIAEALNRPVGTVKTWIHRARRELAEQLLQRGIVVEGPSELRRV